MYRQSNRRMWMKAKISSRKMVDWNIQEQRREKEKRFNQLLFLFFQRQSTTKTYAPNDQNLEKNTTRELADKIH